VSAMDATTSSIECKNRLGPVLVATSVLLWCMGILLAEMNARRLGVPYNPRIGVVGLAVCLPLIIWQTWPILHDVMLSNKGVLVRLSIVGGWPEARLLGWEVVDELRLVEVSTLPFMPVSAASTPHRRFLEVYAFGKIKAHVPWKDGEELLAEFLRRNEVHLTPEPWLYGPLRSRRTLRWRRA
jgi:hypothetical protein